MSKDEYIAILDKSFANGTPFIDFTDDYIYCLTPNDAAGEEWTEAVYLKEDSSIEKRVFKAEKAWAMFLEEFEKGLAGSVEDLMVGHIKEVREKLAAKPAPERIKGLIADVVANPNSYSAKLPIAKNQGDLAAIKQKL